MITVQVLITRRARYNRLHLLRYIWLFPTLGTNLLEWGSVGTRIPPWREFAPTSSYEKPVRINRILRGAVETVGRIAKRHSSFRTTMRLSTRDYARRVHRECFVSLLFKTSISADHLTRSTTSTAAYGLMHYSQIRKRETNEQERVWPALISQWHKKRICIYLKRHLLCFYNGILHCY